MLILPKIVKCYMQNKRNYTHYWKKNISYLSTVTQSTYTSFVIVQFYRLFLYWHQTFAERGLKLKHRILPSSNKMYKNSFIICHFTQFLQNTSDFVYSYNQLTKFSCTRWKHDRPTFQPIIFLWPFVSLVDKNR